MDNDSIPITVMQFGRDEPMVDQIIVDLERMLNLLAVQGLIPADTLKPVPYSTVASPETIQFVVDIAKLAMAQEFNAGIQVRWWALKLLLIGNTASAGQFARLLQIVPDATSPVCQVEPAEMMLLYGQGDVARQAYGLRSGIIAPDILLLPAEYQGRFDYGAHGISGTCFGRGEFIILCPPRHYAQILWHEACHLLFGVKDCYDDRWQPTCELANCIMQWEPSYCDPNREWLCARQMQAVKGAADSLLSIKESLLQRFEAPGPQ